MSRTDFSRGIDWDHSRVPKIFKNRFFQKFVKNRIMRPATFEAVALFGPSSRTSTSPFERVPIEDLELIRSAVATAASAAAASAAAAVPVVESCAVGKLLFNFYPIPKKYRFLTYFGGAGVVPIDSSRIIRPGHGVKMGVC